jgi:hypothetical protein
MYPYGVHALPDQNRCDRRNKLECLYSIRIHTSALVTEVFVTFYIGGGGGASQSQNLFLNSSQCGQLWDGENTREDISRHDVSSIATVVWNESTLVSKFLWWKLLEEFSLLKMKVELVKRWNFTPLHNFCEAGTLLNGHWNRSRQSCRIPISQS